MGVVRLLCITILFAACFVAADDCNANGWIPTGHTNCVCNSGYDNISPDCGNAFGAVCNPAAAAASEKKDDRFPVLDQAEDMITFTNNVLKLAIVGEIVPGRQYNNIVFVPPTSAPVAEQCKFAGNSSSSYWTQSGQTAGGNCLDQFELNMPWTSWQECGFALSSVSQADYWTYRATFVITYTDAVGQPIDIPEITYHPDLFRHSSVAYKVYVRFLKSIDIITYLQINVNNTIDLEVALTKFEYDPSTMVVTMGISTIMSFPNKYLRNTVSLSEVGNADITIQNSGAPTTVAASADEDNIYCREDMGNCLQYFEFDIHLDNGCDFNADYTISGTSVTCRDDTPDCTQAVQEALLKVSSSDVCGSVTADPQITGKLMSYDADHNPQDNFVLGYRGYFEVDMDTLNDFNLTWIDIWVVADMDVPSPDQINSVTLPNIQWLYKDGTLQSDGFHKFDGSMFATGTFGGLSPVDLKVYDVTQNNNNPEVVFTPKFDFKFDSRIFFIPLVAGGNGVSLKGYSLHAKGKIVYRGNEQYNKRSEEFVDFVWKTDAAGMDSSVHFSLMSSEMSSVAGSSKTNTALLASLVPVAGIALVVIAVALVAAVAIVKRKKSTSFTTLGN